MKSKNTESLRLAIQQFKREVCNDKNNGDREEGFQTSPASVTLHQGQQLQKLSSTTESGGTDLPSNIDHGLCMFDLGGDINRTGPDESSSWGESSDSDQDDDIGAAMLHPLRRSKSLIKGEERQPKSPKTKKIVRFADALGLELESVRHFNNDMHVPSSAYHVLRDSLMRERSQKGNLYLAPCFTVPASEESVLQRVHEHKVVLESCKVDDQTYTVIGLARVANLHFVKEVFVRYTVDGWRTCTDAKAMYVQYSNDGPTDRFSFLLNIPRDFALQNCLEFALRYETGSAVYWDNNEGKNYTIECYARVLPMHRHDRGWIHFL